jgi:hypothetical protein
VVIPPSGQIARVSVSQTEAGAVEMDGVAVPIVANVYGDVVGLPSPVHGTIYIVSGLVLSRVADRKDVVAPDTGATAIRDSSGQIVAVTRFVGAGD